MSRVINIRKMYNDDFSRAHALAAEAMKIEENDRPILSGVDPAKDDMELSPEVYLTLHDKYGDSYNILERAALELTDLDPSARPHPDLEDAHLALWGAAAAVALRAGFAQNARFAVDQAIKTAVNEDYDVLESFIAACQAADNGEIRVPEQIKDLADWLEKMKTKLKNQMIRIPMASLMEYPPVLNAYEARIREQRKGTQTAAQAQSGIDMAPVFARFDAIEKRLDTMEKTLSDIQLEIVKSGDDAAKATASLEGMRKAVDALMNAVQSRRQEHKRQQDED